MENKKRKGLIYLINNSNKNISIESKYNLRKRKNPEINKDNSKEIFLKIKKINIKPNNNQNRVICKKYSYKSQLTLNSLSTISTFRANNTNESIENKNENIIEYIRKKYKKHDVNNYINNKKKSKSIQKKNEIKIEENNEYKENINLFNSCNLKIKNYNKKDIINIQKNYNQKNKEIITKKIKNENENYLNLKFNTIETDYFLLNNEKNFFNNSNESLVKKMKKNKKKTGFNICNTDNKNKISNYSYNLFKKKINIYNKKSFGEKNLFFYKNNLTLNFNENNNIKSKENSSNNILLKPKKNLCFITKEIKIKNKINNNNSKIKIKLNLNFITKFIKKNLDKSNLNFVSKQNKIILKKEKLKLSFISKKIYCLPILRPQINEICYITKNIKKLKNKRINKTLNLKYCFITKIIINEKIKNEKKSNNFFEKYSYFKNKNNKLNNFTNNLIDDKNNNNLTFNYSSGDLQLSTSDNSNNNKNKNEQIDYFPKFNKKEFSLQNNNSIFQIFKQNFLEFVNKIIENHIKYKSEKQNESFNEKSDLSTNSKDILNNSTNNKNLIKIETYKIHLKSHSTKLNSKSKKIFISNPSLSFNLLSQKIDNIKFNTQIKPKKNKNKFLLKSKEYNDNDLKENNIYIKIIIKEDIIDWLKSIEKLNLNNENVSKELSNNLNWDKIDEIIIRNKINLFKIVKSFLEISIELIIENNNNNFNNNNNNNIDKLKFYIQNILDYYSSDLSLNNKKILQKKFVNYFFNLTLKLNENNNNIFELLGNTLFILIKNNLFILKDLDFFINNNQNSKINMIKILGFMINTNFKSNKHCFNEIKKTNFYLNDKNLFNEILLIYE